MHEVGIILSAIDVASARAAGAGATRIERLTFAIVPGGHVTTDAVGTLFLALSRGTMAEGARLEFQPHESERYCLACAKVYTGAIDAPGCPRCGQEGFLPPDLADLRLTSIEVSD
ncbi:MAG TPA: hydrogenase maturation nickel metallochaperone HypA [Chloroflexota bacterium]|nr:hydrogenase maturation nickel metallochaperone HypA [Chloroflexota bacterium]